MTRDFSQSGTTTVRMRRHRKGGVCRTPSSSSTSFDQREECLFRPLGPLCPVELNERRSSLSFAQIHKRALLPVVHRTGTFDCRLRTNRRYLLLFDSFLPRHFRKVPSENLSCSVDQRVTVWSPMNKRIREPHGCLLPVHPSAR